MNAFLGFLLLLTFYWSSATGEARFSASITCERCTIHGKHPNDIDGFVKGKLPNDIDGFVKARDFKPSAGYEHFPGVGYYKFYSDRAMTFSEAEEICKNDGAHLAIVNSHAEQEVLKKIYGRHPSARNAAYLGFSDREQEGKYITIFGEPLEDTGFTTWMPGEPNNLEGNEDCGSFYRHGGLNDLWCDKHGPWPFFCEHSKGGHKIEVMESTY